MKNNFNNPSPGKMVRVGEHSMHVFTEGQGNKTLVFLSGHGTACPTLDFKPLWSRLTDTYKIVVVERFGYGWSDITETPRDLNTVLANTREALKLAGLTPPYVLVPHSLSGLEAIYWAQNYPQEVESIIMLDPNVPEMAETIKPSFIMKTALKIMGKMSKNMSEEKAKKALTEKFPSGSFNLLSNDDQVTYIDVFRNRTYTPDMLQEMNDLVQSIKLVKSNPMPIDIPLLLFSSDFGSNPKYAKFLRFHKEFAEDFKHAKHIELNCGHYVHSYQPEKIAGEIRAFLECAI